MGRSGRQPSLTGEDGRMSTEQLCKEFDIISTGEDIDLDAMGERYGNYVTKKIVSGGYVEFECYPIPVMTPEEKRAVRSRKVTKEEWDAYNRKQSELRFVRLLEANFDENDWLITGTIEGENLPKLEEVAKMTKNYLRRVNYELGKLGMEKAAYIYVLEGYEEESRKKRLHVHMVVKCGLERIELKRLWKWGVCRVDELDPAGYGGLTRLASYLSKDPKGKKRWGSSKGLKKPKVETIRKKYNARTAQRIADNRAAAEAALEKMNPRYKMESGIEIKTHPFIKGVVTIKWSMRLREEFRKHEQGHTGGKHGGGRGDQEHGKRREVRSVPPRGEKTVRKSGRRA